MLLISGCVFFLSHFPQFLFTLLMTFNLERIVNFCLNKSSCDIVNEITGFFTLLIITFQFFIFLRFNHNVRKSFQDLKAFFISTLRVWCLFKNFPFNKLIQKIKIKFYFKIIYWTPLNNKMKSNHWDSLCPRKWIINNKSVYCIFVLINGFLLDKKLQCKKRTHLSI